MARADVEEIDNGWKDLESQLKDFQNSSILVGIQEKTTTKEEVKGGRIKEGGKSMPQIAFENEFGTKKIPARPFLRTSFDENISKVNKLINQQYAKVENGKSSADKALKGIGVMMEGLIKQKIRSIVTPPNSPKTIKLKGSSKPLIDFGQMIQSVRYKIEK